MTIVRNPRSGTEAVLAAEQMVRASRPGFQGLCDHTVALFYGWGHSGEATAYDHWLAIPASLRHNDIATAPTAALLFWKGRSHAAPGHVGMSKATGHTFYASDSAVTDHVGVASIDQPHNEWGLIPLGWAAPYFPNGSNAIRVANRIWPEPQAPSPKPVPIWYTVGRGDTLSGIASDHHLTLAQLLAYNRPPYRSDVWRTTTPIYAGTKVVVGIHK